MNFQPKDTAFIASPDSALADLMGMLRTMRPAYSKAEKRFIADWLTPLGVWRDSAGNVFKRIGDSPVLWSSHTDTVHWKDGPQRIQVKGDTISLAWNEKRATCLGADCTVGVWLMREMILARVPGLYVFHAAEECGGGGSSYIADKTPGVLDGIEFAIAFDRMGKRSVITYQGGSRCCSEAFSDSIAEQLPGPYVSDDGGLFTDTANYTHIIPECTNLSIGYTAGHCRSETQSVSHALALREAMLNIDPSQFACARDPYTCDDTLRSNYKGRGLGKDWWRKESKVGGDALVDGPWDDEIQEEFDYEGETWVKRNGVWFKLEDLDDCEEEEEASDYLNPDTYSPWYEKDDPLEFNGWKPKKFKW